MDVCGGASRALFPCPTLDTVRDNVEDIIRIVLDYVQWLEYVGFLASST